MTKGIALLILSFSCLFHGVISLHCLKCDRVISPRHCHGRTTCSSHEVCFVEQFTGLDGETLYNVGCKSRELCTNTTYSYRSTNMEQNTCSSCCDSSLCNVQGCGAKGYPLNRGPICFNCKQSRDPAHCDQIDVCGQDDMCHIEEQAEFGDIFYTTKCLPKNLCNMNAGSIFGKRSDPQKRTTTRCASCCSGDLCNNKCYRNHGTSYTQPYTKPYNYTTWPWQSHTTSPWKQQTTVQKRTTSDWHMYTSDNPDAFIPASGHYGNLFNIAFMPNGIRENINKTIELLITSPYSNFDVSIKAKHLGINRRGQSSNHAIRTTVPVSLENYASPIGNSGNVYPTGIAISSNKPIFVATVSDYRFHSGEAFSAIPMRDLGSKYVIATYPTGIQFVGVVATQDNTYVSADLTPGNTSKLHIVHAGETGVFFSDKNPIATGGVIESDSPIAVFTGNMFTANRSFETEMLIPAAHFEQQYIVPKIFGVDSIILRVIPSPVDHFATVYITGKNGFYKSTYKEFVNEVNLKNDGYFINAQRNVMVSMYITSANSTRSTFMTLLPAINQFSNNYVITTPSQSRHANYITLIINQKEDENGLRINGGNLLFHAVDRTPIYMFREPFSSISVPLNKNSTAYTITHTNSSVNFGLLVYGFGTDQSYGYPGGFNLNK